MVHWSEREAELLQVLSARESLTREQLAAALGELCHEVKNHYLVLQNLSRTGEAERLDAYLSELVSDVSSIPTLNLRGPSGDQRSVDCHAGAGTETRHRWSAGSTCQKRCRSRTRSFAWC